MSDLPSLFKEIGMVDPETDDTIFQSADIIIECAECGLEQLLEAHQSFVTDECPECSVEGSESTRRAAKLHVSITSQSFVQLDDGYAEADEIEPYLENAESWIRRVRNLTSDSPWQLENVGSSENVTRFVFARPIVDSDNIDYAELRDRVTERDEKIEELRARSA